MFCHFQDRVLVREITRRGGRKVVTCKLRADSKRTQTRRVRRGRVQISAGESCWVLAEHET